MSDKEHTHIFNDYDSAMAKSINSVPNHLVRRQLRRSWFEARKHIQAIEGYARSAASDIFNNFIKNVELQQEKWRLTRDDRY